jgi:hypothetical protein
MGSGSLISGAFSGGGAGGDLAFIERFGLDAASAASSMSSQSFVGVNEIIAFYQIYNGNDNVDVGFRPNGITSGYDNQSRNFAGGNITQTTMFSYRSSSAHTGFGTAHIMSGNGAIGAGVTMGMTCTQNWGIWDTSASTMSLVGASAGIIVENTDLITSITIAVTAGTIYGDCVIYGYTES